MASCLALKCLVRSRELIQILESISTTPRNTLTSLALTGDDLHKLFEGNARRVFPRLDKRLNDLGLYASLLTSPANPRVALRSLTTGACVFPLVIRRNNRRVGYVKVAHTIDPELDQGYDRVNRRCRVPSSRSRLGEKSSSRHHRRPGTRSRSRLLCPSRLMFGWCKFTEQRVIH